jgi:16S rRNA (adenine1518-N6/adenine1519-N6)-dimethyltransferase
MSLLKETKRILRVNRIAPRKRLGQSFLVDDATLRRMVSYASLSEEDVVLEVGAGLGFLTETLAEEAKQVTAVEIDPKLVKALKDRLSNCRNVTILCGDIMELTVPRFDKVVSTPPYSISSPLLFWLLEKRFKQAILTFQEEFAKRLAASPSSGDYGRLTVTTYYRAEVDLLDLVPREMFWPPPKVDSTIVRLRPREPPFFVEDEDVFFEVVRAIFTQKNKKLRNAIMPFLGSLRIPKRESQELADALQFCDRRPRELSPEEIGLTANEVVNKKLKHDYRC